MIQLTKNLHFRGTIGNLTFYQCKGRNLVRTKGSVTRERVLKNQEYATTRQYANKLALASRIASPIYRALPENRRARWVFRTITGDAASLLYKGMTENEVRGILWRKYLQDTGIITDAILLPPYNPYSSTIESNKKLQKVFLDRWRKLDKDLSYFKKAWKDPRSYDPQSVKQVNNPLSLLFYDKRRQ